MLQSLAIRNFVIVESLELDFAPGFTVLTGETGAGKSILIDALLLALGERGDADVVREGAPRAEISAGFRAGPAVVEWLQAQGGVAAIEKLNEQKARILYDLIDASDYYRGVILPEFRGTMNVSFNLATPELEEKFLKEAGARGLYALKGHRSVGGIRASIYNAMPLAGVEALAGFMQEFQRQNG